MYQRSIGVISLVVVVLLSAISVTPLCDFKFTDTAYYCNCETFCNYYPHVIQNGTNCLTSNCHKNSNCSAIVDGLWLAQCFKDESRVDGNPPVLTCNGDSVNGTLYAGFSFAESDFSMLFPTYCQSTLSSLSLTSTPSMSASGSMSMSLSATQSMSSSSSLSSSSSPSASSSNSPTTSVSPSPSSSSSVSVSSSASATGSSSMSATITPSSSPSVSMSSSATVSRSRSSSMSASSSKSGSATVSASRTASPSITPSPSPHCDAGLLCSTLSHLPGYNYQTFVDSCLNVVAGSDCGSCENWVVNGSYSTWNSSCCDRPNIAFSGGQCCSQTSFFCQSWVNSIHSSNCWDFNVACVNSNGTTTATVTVGSKFTFESYFKASTGHPLVLPTQSPSPTPSVTPSVTPSISKTPSVTPSITPTITPTKSDTPSTSPTPSITPSPSKLSNMLPNWINLTVCDNLTPVLSYQSTLPRDILWPNYILWNDMDAVLDYTCTHTYTPYACEWILTTSVRIMHPVGYAGIRVWSVYDFNATDKILLVDRSFMFQENAKCTVDGAPCELLPLTTSTDLANNNKSAWAQFRMAMFNDTRTRPFIVEWIDESLVPHAMRPLLGDVLATFMPTPLPIGRSFDINQALASADLTIGLAVICVFVGMLVVIMIISVFKKGVVTDKRQYMLDTEGFRTKYKPSKELQITVTQTYHRNKFSKQHVPFVLIVLGWRICYSIIFTLSFFWVMFQSINQPHFQTMDSWKPFTHDRDSQILSLMKRIEYEYGNESTRMDYEYEVYNASCSVSTVIDENFADQETVIRNYHDEEIAKRENGVHSSTIMYQVSRTTACSTNTSLGASYEMNTLVLSSALTVFNDTLGMNVTTTNWAQFDPSNMTTSDVQSTLQKRCESVTWCEGFAYRSDTFDYFFFYSLATPNIEPNVVAPGFCYAINTVKSSWPSSNLDQQVSSELDRYKAKVNATYNTLNNILASLEQTYDDTFHVNVDRNSERYGWLNGGLSLDIAFSGGQWSTDVTGTYGCPDCAQHYDTPTLPTTTSSSQNVSFNSTYVNRLNQSFEIQSLFVDVQNLSITYSEPDFSILLPPTWKWNLYSISLNPLIFKVVLSLDTFMFVYRTILTITVVSKYIRGVEKDVPATMLGRKLDIKWMLDVLFCSIAFRFLRWLAKKMRHWDHTLWILWGKILFLMQLCVLLLIVLIAYWVVDNAISLDTFDQFGVFSAMTAAPAAQRTLRNEQLVTKGYAYNQVAEADFKSGIYLKAGSIYKQQDQFNTEQYKKVNDFNEEYCSAISTALLYPFTMQTDTNSGCCPSVISPSSVLVFSLDASEQDGITNYVIDQIQFDFLWQPTALPVGSSSTSSSCYDYSVYADITTLSLNVNLLQTLNNSITQNVYSESVSWVPLSSPPSKCVAVTPTSYFMSQQTTSITVNPSAVDSIYASTLSLQFPMHSMAYSTFSLSGITVEGHISSSEEIACDKVIWHELDFKIKDYVANCSSVAPVSTVMMRIFDRDNWTATLKEAHRPFINAMRNIALSPFYILTVALVVLVVVLLFLSLLEWCMVKVDLVRANAFVRVPCIIADRKQVRVSKLQTQGKLDGTLKDNDDDDGDDLSARNTPTEATHPHARPAVVFASDSKKAKRASKKVDPAAATTANMVELQEKKGMVKESEPLQRGPTSGAEPPQTPHANAIASARESNKNPDWVEVFTPEGTPYYYNQKTNETAWEIPSK
eukprot:c7412_g1_i1.p1 GENE.c7412_g1_i1~~c7412_g1_i1.p1  ORF type:complete len:1722 (-),score=389.05 c7412_g1_i1:1239-6404(-)